MISAYRKCLAGALGLLCLGFAATSASAAEFPYQFDPVLSLTGDCSKVAPDTVPDPDCPYPPLPDRPSAPFDEPRSIAIDAYGNEYVASYALNGTKGRIDVFDDEGHFITELADPHGPLGMAVDSKGNLYVFEQSPGNNSEIVRYAPTVYEPEAGNIAYGNPRVVIETNELTTNGLAIDASNDRLFVAHAGVIREYGSATEGNTLLNTITHPKLQSSNWAAVDSQRRRLYASYCKNSIIECGVLVFEADAPYALLKEIDGSQVPAGKFGSGKGWTSIAVDEESGHFFVEDLEKTDNVYEFDASFEYVTQITFGAFTGGNALQIAFSNSPLDEEAKNHRYLFVPGLTTNRALAFKPPGVLPPVLEAPAAENVGESEVELRATLDPKGGETEYVIEYVSEAQFAETGFDNAQVAGQGTIPEGAARRIGAAVSGLTPGTAYRFRVSAKNEAGDAAPVEASFATYSDAPTTQSCPNQALRAGASANLPDCRAYELVTPPDTNGRPPTGVSFNGDLFSTVQASPLGNAVSFMTEGGQLPGTEGTGGFHGDLYRSTRGAGGWGTVQAGPTGVETNLPIPGSTSPDQGYAFWVAGGEGTAVVEEGQQSRYVRYPDGHSELVGRGSLGTDPTARGMLITEGGTHIVFQTDPLSGGEPQQLEPDAPPTGTEAVYDRTADEVTHVVSLLPGNVTPPDGADATYLGASPEGNGIAFEIGGTLYLRKDNAETFEIGTGVEFAGVSEGGKRIFYVQDEDLLAFDTEAEETIAFTDSGDATVVNVAPDGSRAYFVSPSVLTGGEENPNGATAQPGGQNLYLSEEGQIGFVATVTERDVEGEVNSVSARVDGLGLWTEALVQRQPAKDPSRLTPDGSVLLFQSRANLDGYDPGGFAQVYRYDSTADRLHCLSCIPTRAPATGGARFESYAPVMSTDLPFSAHGFVPNLRPDGERAFFESTEALVSTDTDGVTDVYEWEEEGVGSCTRPGGCVYLISSGRSGGHNYLYGISTSGDDVFFTTSDVLVAGDTDTRSIYDARVGGGFPVPLKEACVGEACHPGLTPAPSLPVPQSGARRQSGNVSQPKRCPKGKRKVRRAGKVRCVRRNRGKGKAARRKATQKRRASR